MKAKRQHTDLATTKALIHAAFPKWHLRRYGEPTLRETINREGARYR